MCIILHIFLKLHFRAGGEHLHGKCEALSSSPQCHPKQNFSTYNCKECKFSILFTCTKYAVYVLKIKVIIVYKINLFKEKLSNSFCKRYYFALDLMTVFKICLQVSKSLSDF
jgi:hypothetical protein